MAALVRSVVFFACVAHFFEREVLCAKGLTRNPELGLAYAKFVDHLFHYLNVSQVGSYFVHKLGECAEACVRSVSCFSFNVAAHPDVNGHFLCELLASDKYNSSAKFQPNPSFNHYSIFSPCSEMPCMNGGTCIALYFHDDFKCKCPPEFKGKNCDIETIDIYMLSAGWEDTVIGKGGKAVIKVNGVDKSPNKKGHNVVALDRSGSIVDTQSFDTHGDASAGGRMAEFINNLPNDTIVLVSVRDSGKKFVADAVEALASVGAVKPVIPGYRESWLLVGYKGSSDKPFWVQQAQGPRNSTPSEVKTQIYF